MTLAAFVCCFMLTSVFTSCTNSDNPAASNQGSAGIVVNPSTLYNELGIIDLMNQHLASGETIIFDSVLIYNEAGSLVSKLGAETHSMQRLTIKADALPDGTYTLVVWQTIRDINDLASVWTVNDEDKLSTVNITSRHSGFGYRRSIGMASATVTVVGGQLSATLAPKPMGSIVELQVDGFTDDKGVDEIHLVSYTEELPYGFKLDPAASEDDRWITIPFKQVSPVISIAIQYLGEEPVKHFTLSHGDDFQMTVYGRSGETKVLLDAYYHTALTAGDNKVFYMHLDRQDYQPPFFGTPEETAAWKADRDNGILVCDPCLNWGCNWDEVQQEVVKRQWYKIYDKTPRVYRNNGMFGAAVLTAHHSAEEYDFETEDGKNLKGVYYDCYSDGLTLEMAEASIVKKGYIYQGVFDNHVSPATDLYLSPDGKTEVMCYQAGEGHICIFYQPTDPDDFQYVTKID